MIVTGRETLGSIDKATRQLQTEERDAALLMRTLNDQLVTLAQEQAIEYRALAEFRAENILRGDLINTLSRAEQEAADVLNAHMHGFDEVDAAIAADERALDDLRARREPVAERLEAAEERLDRALLGMRDTLMQHAVYAEATQTAEMARRRAAAADEKIVQAEADRVEKSKAYQSDRLFMYLWERGYGTSKYTASGLIRLLDGWVARLVGYQDARPNYFMLNEIPKRLTVHAQRMRALAAEQAEALVLAEERALKQTGKADLVETVEALRGEKADIDSRIETLSKELQGAREKRANLAKGGDDAYARALEPLQSAISQEPLTIMYERAARTGDQKDDRIVSRIRAIRQKIDQIEQVKKDTEQRLRQIANNRTELENVRGRFKRQRYDDYGSVFGSMAGVLLGEFLKGMINGGTYWDGMRRNQRWRRRHWDDDLGWPGGFGGGFGDDDFGGGFGGGGGDFGGGGGGDFTTTDSF